MFEKRWYQAEAKDSIFTYFESGKTGNPIVAMPTGTGKSVVISDFIREIFIRWPTQRIMMLTHVKELISQNAEKLLKFWPTAPLGIHSAGLNSRDFVLPIVFGGVQSVSSSIKKAVENSTLLNSGSNHFGFRDLVLIDECHLVSEKESSQYQFVISELKKINPYLKVIGFTATKYRMKSGLLIEGDSIFTDVCYDVTGLIPFNRLLNEGFLAPLIPRPVNTQIDLSGVSINADDYVRSQLNKAVDKDEITYNSVKEMIELGFDRKAWLVFASGIENCEHVKAMLESFGVSCVSVHSKKTKAENDKAIEMFKNGEVRCIVNSDKLTTGFDHPPIDLIAMLRPTLSPGLWVQMLGRGTRPFPGKENCLVLDFARNTPRLGPINDPVIPRRKGIGGKGEAPVRVCEFCGTYNHAGAKFCINPLCGEEFTFKTKLFGTSGTDLLIKSDIPQIEEIKVDYVIYNLHQKQGSPSSIKVSYCCGLRRFDEWICLEHQGIASKKARDWWQQRHAEPAPPTTYAALQKVSQLRKPEKIKVWVNKKYPEIMGTEW